MFKNKINKNYFGCYQSDCEEAFDIFLLLRNFSLEMFEPKPPSPPPKSRRQMYN